MFAFEGLQLVAVSESISREARHLFCALVDIENKLRPLLFFLMFSV